MVQFKRRDEAWRGATRRTSHVRGLAMFKSWRAMASFVLKDQSTCDGHVGACWAPCRFLRRQDHAYVVQHAPGRHGLAWGARYKCNCQRHGAPCKEAHSASRDHDDDKRTRARAAVRRKFSVPGCRRFTVRIRAYKPIMLYLDREPTVNAQARMHERGRVYSWPRCGASFVTDSKAQAWFAVTSLCVPVCIQAYMCTCGHSIYS